MVCFNFNTLWRCRRGLGAEPGARLSPPAPRPAPRVRTGSRSRLTRGCGSFAAVVGASGAGQSGRRHRRGTTPGAAPQRWSSTGADRQTDRQPCCQLPHPRPSASAPCPCPGCPKETSHEQEAQGSIHGPAEPAGSAVAAFRALAGRQRTETQPRGTWEHRGRQGAAATFWASGLCGVVEPSAQAAEAGPDPADHGPVLSKDPKPSPRQALGLGVQVEGNGFFCF